MSRQIEIDSYGILNINEVNGGYVECPLKAQNRDDKQFCSEYCAWIQIDTIGNVLCGEKLIGQLTTEEGDND